MKCDFCLLDRLFDHTCPDTPTVRARQRRLLRRSLLKVDTIGYEIDHSQSHPNWKAETSAQVEARAERQRNMVTGAQLAGVEVRPEWQ
jgi:hypothetical protein